VLGLGACVFAARCRKAAQDEAMKENAERLEALGRMAAQLASRHEAVLQEQLEGVRRRHRQLCHRLLRLLRHVSARGRMLGAYRAAGRGGRRGSAWWLSARFGAVPCRLVLRPAVMLLLLCCSLLQPRVA
jgi:hypothetical protein